MFSPVQRGLDGQASGACYFSYMEILAAHIYVSSKLTLLCCIRYGGRPRTIKFKKFCLQETHVASQFSPLSNLYQSQPAG